VSGVVAAEMGMDWNIAHEAFVAYAEQVLPAAPPPVRVLGLDETRRGKGRYEVVTSSTGVKVWVDRFDTGLVDPDGTGGLFAQVNGRNSAAVIAWLRAQDRLRTRRGGHRHDPGHQRFQPGPGGPIASPGPTPQTAPSSFHRRSRRPSDSGRVSSRG